VVEKQEVVEPLEKQALGDRGDVGRAGRDCGGGGCGGDGSSILLPQSLIQAVGETMTASAGYAARTAVAMEVSCGEGRVEDPSHPPLNLRSSRNPL
jgi:hypothetical protein